MKRKIVSVLLFALGAGILAGGAFLLPVLADSRLKAEYETVHVQDKETGEPDGLQEEAVQASGKELYAELSAQESEKYLEILREEIESQLGIPADASVKLVFQDRNEKGDLLLTWAKDVPQEVDPQDNVYYSAEFALPVQDGQEVYIRAAGISGTQYQDQVQKLAKQAEESFKDQFQVQVPEKIPPYTVIDWRGEDRQVKLQWEMPDYTANTYTVYEAVFSQVDKSYEEGTLVYLNDFRTKLGDSGIRPELTDQEKEALAQKAKTYGEQLGYEEMELKETYYYRNTVNFCFDVQDRAFGQLCISMEEDGTWSGTAVGNDILKYARQ